MGNNKKKWVPLKSFMGIGLKGNTLNLAVTLSYHIREKGSTYVGVNTLCQESGMTRKTALKHLRILKENNIISIRERIGYTSIYSFTEEFLGGEITSVRTTTPSKNYTGTPSNFYTGTPSKNYTQSNNNQVEKKPSKDLPEAKAPVENKVIYLNTVGNNKNLKSTPTQKEEDMSAEDVKKRLGIINGVITKPKTVISKNMTQGSKLSLLWRREMTTTFGIGSMASYTKKDISMFNLFNKRVAPHNSMDIMTYTLDHWAEVSNDINVKYALSSIPQIPSLPFVLKYCNEIASYYLNTINKPKSIPTIIPKKKVAKIKDMEVSSTDFITADKLEDFSFFKEG